MKRDELYKRTDEYRKHLSDSLKAKWRSGTRKLNSQESRDRAAASLKEAYRTGRRKRLKLSKAIRRRIGRKVSIRNKGRILRKTPIRDWEKKLTAERSIDRRGPGNPREREWRLRSPVNKVYIFKNLQHFIRTHTELFLPEDLAKRASHGIQSICPRKKINVGSWKGWTWYSHLEELKNDGQDLLQRKVQHG